MLKLPGRTASARSRSSSIRSRIEGSVGIIFAFTLIPVIGIVGLGIDYGVATSNKAKLDRAADAAAVAAVVTAKTYLANNPTQTGVTTKAIAAGIAQATSVFKVNAGNISLGTYQLQTPQLTRTGQTFRSTVTYTAVVQNSFGRIFNVPTVNLQNTTSAAADVSSYLDFYLMVDVSGSMGLPTTAAGMTTLASKNDDMYDDYKQGCQFACHFPDRKGWTLAAGKIQLRSDAVNSAVCSLLARAATSSVTDQYRVGIYPFINQLATLSPLTSNISSLNTAAQCGSSWPLAFTNLLDTGTTQLFTAGDPTTGTGSGGTHFDDAFKKMRTTVSKFGDGSTASVPKSFIFVITDGMQNDQHYFVKKNSSSPYSYPGRPSTFPGHGDAWWDGSKPSKMDPKECQALKDDGATISILHIPYNQIAYVDRGGGVAWENGIVNGFSPTLDVPLKACASPGFFRTANTPADITAALNAMFDQAVQVAHITQ
ncbi:MULTISPECIES: pilus assembly protein TadG-related protein [unclassified Methylobacterium]|uniref:pilus assembly protein TadG-related protein n=1 Tax=unclassified Methylobacterium TaxID=2615210 RepID=UPI0006F22EDB|nr:MULTISPECIES: pilus assembly protein TadG-related protein [unclassified Methylobacterium]KQP61497.1 phosphomannomutase [Methylobacterium sp. Leaf108]KQT80700.1 phosphomannomutase [Methylobacterium sp. Leaf466]